jgi:hypothetical protein
LNRLSDSFLGEIVRPVSKTPEGLVTFVSANAIRFTLRSFGQSVAQPRSAEDGGINIVKPRDGESIRVRGDHEKVAEKRVVAA